MDAVSLLKNNLSSLVSINDAEATNIAKKLHINLSELLSDPVKRENTFNKFFKCI